MKPESAFCSFGAKNGAYRSIILDRSLLRSMPWWFWGRKAESCEKSRISRDSSIVRKDPLKPHHAHVGRAELHWPNCNNGWIHLWINSGTFHFTSLHLPPVLSVKIKSLRFPLGRSSSLAPLADEEVVKCEPWAARGRTVNKSSDLLSFSRAWRFSQ